MSTHSPGLATSGAPGAAGDGASRPVWLAAGVRTPFLATAGAYAPLLSYELAARTIAGLVERTEIDPALVERVAMGTVVHETDTPNLAREAMLAAGLPARAPAWTTSMAGLSPNIAVSSVADAIALGHAEVGLAGGVESFSDVPIRLSRGVRRAAMRLRQDRSMGQRLRTVAGLRPRDLTLDVPRSADVTTGLTMGAATETLASAWGVTRKASDELAATSHQRALAAWDVGAYDDHVLELTIEGTRVTRDDTPRADTSPERLAELTPAFDRRGGVITAGNASGFTDGAAALVLASTPGVERCGLDPLARLVDTVFVGVDDPAGEMLLGPALAIPRLLARHRLAIDDVAVFEVHEAFASQILAVQAALGSLTFARDRLERDEAVGAMPADRLNDWGGSLALGNPFSATGGRLLLTAAARLRETGSRYAVVSSCAGGGLGTAMLLEHPDGT